jgi:hypothetical protein
MLTMTGTVSSAPVAGDIKPERHPEVAPQDKGGSAVSSPKKAQQIKLAVIDRLNLATLTPGKLVMIEVDPGGPNEKVVMLRMKSVNVQGSDEFESNLLECSQKGQSCDSGGNFTPSRTHIEAATKLRCSPLLSGNLAIREFDHQGIWKHGGHGRNAQ